MEIESQLLSFLIGLVSIAIVALVGSHIWVLRELARHAERLTYHTELLDDLLERVK